MKDEILWHYSGETSSYHITMNGEQIHVAKSEFDRDIFIATLKANIRRYEEQGLVHSATFVIKGPDLVITKSES